MMSPGRLLVLQLMATAVVVQSRGESFQAYRVVQVRTPLAQCKRSTDCIAETRTFDAELVCREDSIPAEVACVEAHPGLLHERRSCACRSNCRLVSLTCTLPGWHGSVSACATAAFSGSGPNSLRYRFSNATFSFWCTNRALYSLQPGGRDYVMVACEDGFLQSSMPRCGKYIQQA